MYVVHASSVRRTMNAVHVCAARTLRCVYVCVFVYVYVYDIHCMCMCVCVCGCICEYVYIMLSNLLLVMSNGNDIHNNQL